MDNLWLNIKVHRPSINNSFADFLPKDNNLFYALGAIKNVGFEAISQIIKERENNGNYKNIFDFICRTSSRAVNKKTYESLALAGSFDDLEDVDRKKYIYSNENELSFIEKAISYSNKLQKEKETKQTFLFKSLFFVLSKIFLILKINSFGSKGFGK